MFFKKIILGIGIFIVFLFLLHNGIRAFYVYPEYSDFESCSGAGYSNDGYIPYYPEKINLNCSMSNELFLAEQRCMRSGGQAIFDYTSDGCVSSLKECNYCINEYNEAIKEYNKFVFVIAILVGIITLFIGWLVLSVEPVGSALISSAIGSIIYGTIVNWENLGNMGRFLLLFIAFVLLVFIALRINSQSKKNKWKFWKRYLS